MPVLGYVALYVVLLLARVPSFRRARAQGRRDAATAVQTTGRVVDVAVELSSSTSDSLGNPWYRPKVAYWGQAGEVLERATVDQYKFKHWQVGEVIPIWVDPAAPNRVWWRRPGPGSALKDLALYVGILTFFFLVGGVLLLAFGIL